MKSALQPYTPQTPAEWQEAANAARLWLLIDSAKLYGLVTGGPLVDVGRCEWIIREAARRGVKPAEDEP